MISEKKTARTAGLWYLAIAVFYLFGMAYVDKSFFVAGDVGATVKNIQASSLLFQLGFLSCLLGHVCFLFLVSTLFKLLGPVDEGLSRLMVILVITGVSVSFLARLNQAAAMLLLSGADGLSVFSQAQLQALAFFFLDLLQHGEMMATVFWGLWLLPLGLLTFKSGFLPKALGILLILAGICYLTEFFLYFCIPQLLAAPDTPLSLIETTAEIAFILWLLVVGQRTKGSAVSLGD